jgi:DNA-directed RNA polymerase specialized sigma24 family protein
MRAEGRDVCERDLRRIHGLLPDRAPLRPHEVDIGDPSLEEALAVAPAAGAAGSDGDEERARLFAAVDHAIRALPPEDQLIVRLRYGESLSIADVARALGLAEKPLYRRLPTIVRRVRELLEAAGYSRVDAEEVLADD